MRIARARHRGRAHLPLHQHDLPLPPRRQPPAYGSGKLSGIVVHELFPRFEWEDNASGDDESYGYIGRYQLRHVSKSDFDGLAEDFEDSFSALLTEYRFLQYDNNKVYPTYGTNGYLTHSYKDGTGAIKILANEDFSYLGPVGNKSSFIFGSNTGNVNGMGIILEDGTDWWRDNPDVNSNTSGDTSAPARARFRARTAPKARHGSTGTGGTRPTTAGMRGS